MLSNKQLSKEKAELKFPQKAERKGLAVGCTKVEELHYLWCKVQMTTPQLGVHKK